MPKILALAGSLRKNSYNKRVLNIAVEAARQAGAEVNVIDLANHPLPIFNADLVDEQGFDTNAIRLQELFNEHDGFLIASPEYNGSLPGGFKNAIDWASRKSEKFAMYEVFKKKTAAIMTASPGQFGGLRCLGHLRGVLTIMGVTVLPTEIAVTFVATKFDGDGVDMTEEKTRKLLESLGRSLAEALK